MISGLPTSEWEALPLHGPLLLEASAGTGKTYTIALLYLRLLIERTDIDVSQILVVTYTEAATAELRERLRSRLHDALQVLHALASGKPLDEHDALALWLKRFCKDAEHARHLALRIESARLSFDQTAIHTIHGFCLRTLREFAFGAGENSGHGAQLDSNALGHEILMDWWRRQIERPEPWISRVLGTWIKGPELLWKQLRAVLNYPTAVLIATPDIVAATNRFDDCWGKLCCTAAITELSQVLSAEEKVFCLRAEHKRALQSLHRDLLNGQPDSAISGLLDSTQLPGAQKGKPQRQLNAVACYSTISALADADAELTRNARAYLLNDAIDYLRTEIKIRSRRVPGFIFNDLIAGVDEALHARDGDKFATALFERWPCALIDEFQDTDARQFGIFRRIYQNGTRGFLALIGDAKQAIYGFRGGDVRACLQARHLPGVVRYALAVNQRSDAQLVAAVNFLFNSAGANSVFETEMLEFTAARARRSAAESKFPKPFSFIVDAENSSANTSVTAWSKRCLEATADDIAASLNTTRDLKPGQIAVLVRNNKDIATMLRALTRRGIPAAAEVQQSVFDSRAAQALTIVIAALAESENSSRLRGALLGPLFGWPVARLAILESNHAEWSSVLQDFYWARQRWQQSGPAAALMPWLQQASSRLLQTGDGERFLTDARHLLELLQAEYCARPGIAALLAWLQSERELDTESEAGKERQQRLQSDGDRVRVITLHRAKGLEFDQVWLPLLWQPAHKQKAECIAICHQNDALVIDTGSADFANRLEQSQTEQEAEAVRLLYVGLTRARHRCTVFWVEPKDAASPGALQRVLARAAANSGVESATRYSFIESLVAAPESPFQLRRDWPSSCTLHATPSAVSNANSAPPLPVERQLRGVYSFTRLLDVSAYGHGIASAFALPGDEPEIGSIDNENSSAIAHPELLLLSRLAGSGFGSALHECLEVALLAGDNRLEADDIRQVLRKHGIIVNDDALMAALIRLLDRTLHTELQPGLTLYDLPPQQRVSEFGFELPLLKISKLALESLLSTYGFEISLASPETIDGFLTGSADLVFEWQGRFYIADYKSNALGLSCVNYRGEGLTVAIQSRGYALQYLLYTLALHRHLQQRLGASYRYKEHFGGVFYLFVRAIGLEENSGIYFTQPPLDLIEKLDRLFEYGARARSIP